ncbi:MAG: hypothetical protein LBV26_04025 [Bacteroidales bacterium]|jgi:hypothetical protein|nr:hypothetical protein [Bacteroidales bacterium]
MLHYTLVENLLTAAPDDFMALPLNVRAYGLAEIAQRILARHPGMGLSQINAVIEEFIEYNRQNEKSEKIKRKVRKHTRAAASRLCHIMSFK